ncbi:ABC transporter permease [Lentilactobacillus farraginis]|uniref:Spermidine putrescine ABC superfamily ATP binding cassette transporter, membrane protein n=1 Tax=Lentilactobacillus farraginis DSM 18382 = JCM 14108 TaxID=1423743 RepID=X0PC49_9LACO|nr:ABC transporter permease [Lentilactobacillus farraginis]KRM11198.1 spermidine putrescine ABC superfamily ATP binding cassette transporter, membrane protein [Lentilactobacillus farraginis DSM 18382 = JCM 14108]GAF37979.1 spermidine putrescine ABC transporter permease component PotB [Lentilactobacillus farraginis DSM 18382 = JCM 14108]
MEKSIDSENVPITKTKSHYFSKTLIKWGQILPISIWMLLLVVIPLMYVLIMSFMSRDFYGGIVYKFTLSNFAQVFAGQNLKIYAQSIGIGAVSTVVCLLIAYPFAMFIAQKGPVAKTILMALVVVPSVSNSLVRLFSWITLLRKTGVVNTTLEHLGIIHHPLSMVYNTGGIVLGMVYLLLMFMIIPIFNSLDRIDHNLIEAAEDLGATKWQILKEIVIPLSKPGIFAGCIMVFIPSLGYFFVSDVMGGGTSTMMGNLIENQFQTSRNWPLGSAISVMLIVLTLVLLVLFQRRGGDMADLGGR